MAGQTSEESAEKEPFIRIDGLSKKFGNQFALRNLTLDVARGEFVTLFGPNGAGKTTLIRIISTLSKATQGEVIVDGHSVASASHHIRRQIGVIAHQTFLYDDLTAEENLRFYAKLYDIPDRENKITSLLREVGLEKRRDDRVKTFSRGMQQRLSIARAMLNNPSLLLLDEPYTGLDQHAAEMLSQWLKRLRSSERTTILVTHDLERGLDMASRVTMLNRGRLVFDQRKESVEMSSFRRVYSELVGTKGRAA